MLMLNQDAAVLIDRSFAVVQQVLRMWWQSSLRTPAVLMAQACAYGACNRLEYSHLCPLMLCGGLAPDSLEGVGSAVVVALRLRDACPLACTRPTTVTRAAAWRRGGTGGRWCRSRVIRCRRVPSDADVCSLSRCGCLDGSLLNFTCLHCIRVKCWRAQATAF